jgi:hypothetical protein
VPSSLRAVARFFLPYRSRLAGVFAMAFASALLCACEPLLYKKVFDGFAPGPLVASRTSARTRQRSRSPTTT